MSNDECGELRALLRGLGRTSEGVAASLRARGVRGVKRHGRECPLARLLAGEFPHHRFGVSDTRAEIDGEGRAVLPAACACFVTDFDLGRYPDLIDDAGGQADG